LSKDKKNLPPKDKPQINPYAIYVHCDGAMIYNSKSTGGLGVCIKFPDELEILDVEEAFGVYEGANIERLELEALCQGINLMMKTYKEKAEVLNGKFNTIILITDRYELINRVNPYNIRRLKSQGWKNHENKPIANKDLLDKLDKLRKKLINLTHVSVDMKYFRRKFNKVADKLSKKGMESLHVNKSIARLIKPGKSKYKGEEVKYELLKEDDELIVQVFYKDPISKDEWKLNADICNDEYEEKRVTIYVNNEIEDELHRKHDYKVIIDKVYKHHILIKNDIKEIFEEKGDPPIS
jgi:ribonuclease HI